MGFYSDRSQFRVIMPNLNYGFEVEKLDAKKDEIKRVGNSQKGHWEVIE